MTTFLLTAAGDRAVAQLASSVLTLAFAITFLAIALLIHGGLKWWLKE